MSSTLKKSLLLAPFLLLSACSTAAVYKATSEKRAELTIQYKGGGTNNSFVHYLGKMVGAKCSTSAAEVIAILNNVTFSRGYADGGKNLQEITIEIDASGEPFRVATVNAQYSLTQGWGGLTVHTKVCWPHVQFIPQPGHHYYLDDDPVVNACGLDLTDANGPTTVASFKRLPPCWDEYTSKLQKKFIESYYALHQDLYN